MQFLDRAFLGNDVRSWLVAAGVFLLAYGLLRLGGRWLTARARRLAGSTRTHLDDVVLAAVGAARDVTFLALAALVASRFLDLSPVADVLLRKVVLTILLVQGALSAVAALSSRLELYKTERYADDAAAFSSFTVLLYLGTGTIWVIAVLFGLQVWGVDVTALITGLGIGGVAVALAVQNILGDLFASLSIVLDKPFLVGDFLQVDEMLGTVEAIGMKTTRLRSLSGEQLVISNSDLLRARIRNYGRMEERRAVFTFGVTYETSPDRLERIPTLVRNAVEDQQQTRFDRCHLKRFGDFALEFEAVYWLIVPDYTRYMDVQQAVNIDLVRSFAGNGIDFAYPTQLVYVDGAGSPPGKAIRVDGSVARE